MEFKPRSPKRHANDELDDGISVKKLKRHNTPRIDPIDMSSAVEEIFGSDSELTPINQLPSFESLIPTPMPARSDRPILAEKRPSFNITLINPFRKRAAASNIERESLLEDMKLIRQEYLYHLI